MMSSPDSQQTIPFPDQHLPAGIDMDAVRRGQELAMKEHETAEVVNDESPSYENQKLYEVKTLATELEPEPEPEPVTEYGAEESVYTKGDVIAIIEALRSRGSGVTAEQLASTGVFAASRALNAKKVQGKI